MIMLFGLGYSEPVDGQDDDGLTLLQTKLVKEHADMNGTIGVDGNLANFCSNLNWSDRCGCHHCSASCLGGEAKRMAGCSGNSAPAGRTMQQGCDALNNWRDGCRCWICRPDCLSKRAKELAQCGSLPPPTPPPCAGIVQPTCAGTAEVELSGGNDGNAKNLKACIGECDNDGQCADGLRCFQRSRGEAIPGCKGSGGGRDWDYCYDPTPGYTKVELSGGNDGNARNLKACIGECDSDGQCAAGLKCFQRSAGETIPGCKGSGAGKDWDYCYDHAAWRRNAWNEVANPIWNGGVAVCHSGAWVCPGVPSTTSPPPPCTGVVQPTCAGAVCSNGAWLCPSLPGCSGVEPKCGGVACINGVWYCGAIPPGTDSPGGDTEVTDVDCLDAEKGFGPGFTCASTGMYCSTDSGDGMTVGACCPTKCKAEFENKKKNGHVENKAKNDLERRVKRNENERSRKKGESARKKSNKDTEWQNKRDLKEAKNKNEEGERKNKRGLTENVRKNEKGWKASKAARRKAANQREDKRKEKRGKSAPAPTPPTKTCWNEVKIFEKCARRKNCEKKQKRKGTPKPSC